MSKPFITHLIISIISYLFFKKSPTFSDITRNSLPATNSCIRTQNPSSQKKKYLLCTSYLYISEAPPPHFPNYAPADTGGRLVLNIADDAGTRRVADRSASGHLYPDFPSGAALRLLYRSNVCSTSPPGRYALARTSRRKVQLAPRDIARRWIAERWPRPFFSRVVL